ncbi:hypothetical protein AB4Z39_05050 [Mycobacterium adipatum]|uniref:hypothetical protein n=1 Tax=Mycobacterium adipatum TaxID=1682113 RepID=UPI0034E09902
MAIDIGRFLMERLQHFPPGAGPTDSIEFGAPRVHYESQDTWTSTVSSCLDWRAEIRMTALDAHGQAPDVVVGFVDFLVLQLGRQPVAEVLALYGDRAARFSELFDDVWLAPDLDESDDFTAGMPIGAVLVVLDAQVDARVSPECRLRPWAVAEVIDTMLPTTAGLVVMNAFASPRTYPEQHRRLVSADRIDPDWPLVGCTSIPGHPDFFGQATAYTYLDDARTKLGDVRDQTIDVVP